MRHGIIALLSLLSGSLLLAEEPSHYGWDIPHTPLNIGGYLDLTYDEHDNENFLFDDIALLFAANEHNWDLLGEIELSHLPLNKEEFDQYDMRLNIERFQIGYMLDDTQHITVGRFNSDIGYWNQAPVKFLQETTTYPHIIEHLFPKSTTGLLYTHYFEAEETLSFTFQNNQDIGQQDDSMEIDQHYALAFYAPYDDWSWRMAGGFYREITKQREGYYLGAGGEYENDQLSLQGEFFIKDKNKNQSLPYSGYVQSSWHLNATQDATLRLEGYRDNILHVEEQTMLLGYGYRPTGHITIKGEYVYHTKLPLSRFVFSFSVMF